MKGNKGCFVCRNPHIPNDHHTRDEVRKETNKMKAQVPTALLTTEDLECIDGMFQGTEGDGKNNENEHQGGRDHEVDWAEGHDHSE